MENNLAMEIVKRYGLIIAVSLVLFLSVVDIFFVSVSRPRLDNIQAVKKQTVCRSEGGRIEKEIPKISEIRGPMITEEAAISSCQTREISVCQNLNPNMWVFLLLSYVVLLVFNLAYGIMKNGKIQWVWETIMTGTFIFFWFALDNCAQNLWYPLYITKLALAIYAAYLYFLLRKKENPKGL